MTYRLKPLIQFVDVRVPTTHKTQWHSAELQILSTGASNADHFRYSLRQQTNRITKTDNIRDSNAVPSAYFSKSGSMTKDDAPVSESRLARAKASLIGANFFVETNRFEPLMAVYLIGKKIASPRPLRPVQKKTLSIRSTPNSQ